MPRCRTCHQNSAPRIIGALDPVGPVRCQECGQRWEGSRTGWWWLWIAGLSLGTMAAAPMADIILRGGPRRRWVDPLLSIALSLLAILVFWSGSAWIWKAPLLGIVVAWYLRYLTGRRTELRRYEVQGKLRRGDASDL